LISKSKIANYAIMEARDPMPNENEKTFFDGFPPVPGWYLCRLDGGEIKLFCKRCELTLKMRWYYPDGSPCLEKVQWTK